MVETNWTRAQAAEAAACVAELTALHVELGRILGDDPKRDELWARIEEQHARFATLMVADATSDESGV